MSRGPGALQVKIMRTLKQYHDLGETLGWEFHPGGSFNARVLADRSCIKAYEQAERIPVWMLRRDLEASLPALSRAIKGLSTMGYVWRYGADLDILGDYYSLNNTKYIQLSPDGEQWLSVNNDKVTKLTLNAEAHTHDTQ